MIISTSACEQRQLLLYFSVLMGGGEKKGANSCNKSVNLDVACKAGTRDKSDCFENIMWVYFQKSFVQPEQFQASGFRHMWFLWTDTQKANI